MNDAFQLIIEAARQLFESRQHHKAAELLSIAFDLAPDDQQRFTICENARMCWFQDNDVTRAHEWLERQESLGLPISWEMMRDKSNYLRYLDRHVEAHAVASSITDVKTRALALSWFEHREGLIKKAFATAEQGRVDSYWWRQPPRYPYQIWQGQRTSNLIVVAESGAGDQIIFSRWLPLLRNFCENVWYDGVDTLTSVFKRNFGVISLDHKSMPEEYFVVPVMSLAYRLEVNKPDDKIYLTSDPVKKQRYLDHYASVKPVRIGICCQGEPTHVETALRTVPQRLLIDAIQDFGEIINLQQINQNQDDRLRLIPFDTWEDTLALIDTCDVVISCDTSVAHAAAALGRPTIVLMHAAAYFTWNHNEDLAKTNWYHDAWCVHQDSPCAWFGAISKCAALTKRLIDRKIQ